MRGITGVIISLALAGSNATMAQADDQLPPLSIAMRDTFDAWSVPAGLSPGTTALNKLQVSASLNGDSFGAPGWSAHAQIFRFDGEQLSNRIGDLQTSDSIEAEPLTRLFEAWFAHQWGGKDHSIALRVGLIDLNSQFDSTDAASLFLNSSHGIGPDLSRSGRNGPSIYPVSGLGATLTVVANSRLTLRGGLFDGVPGDPARPRAFVAERLEQRDGVLAVAQVDYQLSKQSRIEVGAWRYSAMVPAADGGLARDQGFYASLVAPVPRLPRTAMWVRMGVADAQAQPVAGYLGLGFVQTGTFRHRPDDRLGFAIAHAIIGSPTVEASDISHAETSFELSYQLKLSERFAAQPDAQYIIHPAGVAHAPNALSFGVRFVFTTGWPAKAKAKATEDTDPTVPPDGAPSLAPEGDSETQ